MKPVLFVGSALFCAASLLYWAWSADAKEAGEWERYCQGRLVGATVRDSLSTVIMQPRCLSEIRRAPR